MNGGTTWTAVTATASWTRVSVPTVTMANPVVGFRIVTSGDSIAVDMVQNENSGVCHLADPDHHGVSGTAGRCGGDQYRRGADRRRGSSQPQGTLFAEGVPYNASLPTPIVSADR